MTIWDRSVATYWDDSVNAFLADNPGYTVEMMDIPSADYITKITAMMAAQDTTDIITVKSMDQYSALTSNENLVNLNSLISSSGFDTSVYGGLEKGITLSDGGLYGLPFRSDIDLLFYNKTLFDNAGVAYPSATVPMTLQQYADLAKKLTSGSGNDQIWGAFNHTWSSCVSDFAVADGTHSLTEAGTDYSWLAPVYNIFLQMQDTDKSAPTYSYLKTGSIAYRDMFYSNQVAMLPMGTWVITDLITKNQSGEISCNWGMAPMPVLSGTKRVTAAGVTPMAINTYSKNQDGAWKLIQYLCGEKGAAALAKTGTIPGLNSTAVTDSLATLPGFPQDCKDALIVDNKSLQIPPTATAGQIKAIQDQQHDLIMLEQEPVDQALKEFADRVKSEVQ